MGVYESENYAPKDPRTDDVSDGMVKARKVLQIVNEQVLGTRSKWQDDIESYESTSEDLRDQASLYSEAASQLREFLYREGSKAPGVEVVGAETHRR